MSLIEFYDFNSDLSVNVTLQHYLHIRDIVLPSLVTQNVLKQWIHLHFTLRWWQSDCFKKFAIFIYSSMRFTIISNATVK